MQDFYLYQFAAAEKLESAELERWQRIEKRGNFAEKMQQGDFASILDTIDTFLAKCQHGPLKIQVLMRKAETLAEQWKALCSGNLMPSKP